MSYELTLTRDINAPREQVFEAWLQPEALAHFMTPGPGMTVPKAECDPQVGGTFLIVMKAGEQELPHRGEYKEIARYSRLVFTWLSMHADAGSLVTLTFEEPAANQTRLTLHHQGLSSEESAQNHQGGWTRILEALATGLAS